MSEETKNRKTDHIKICVEKDVEFNKKSTLLGEVVLPKTVPDMDAKDVDPSTAFLGKKISAPVFVNSITGGEERAEKINKDIAAACEELGLGMALGSQRAMLEDRSLAYTYDVREEHDPAFLLGNIGIAQLGEYTVEELEWLVEKINGDGLFVHINPAQEAVQPEGDTDFSGAMKRLEEIAKKMDYPVIAKQVGEGISRKTAQKLSEMNLYGVDVGGAGGSDWTKIEQLRSEDNYGETFENWGIPTAQSLIDVLETVTGGKVTATGGIRNGLQVAKSLALGADAAGLALPALKAQQKEGKEGVKALLERMVEELKIAMFLTDSGSVEELRSLDPKISPKLRSRIG
ncbi:MAG: type 2 isopentenyl-diphosphate Delta-isomerase [Candidatus Aenigmatarchaeota archaeon]